MSDVVPLPPAAERIGLKARRLFDYKPNADSSHSAQAGQRARDGGQPDLVTEDAAALEFEERFRNQLLFDHDRGSWFRWSGACWRRDPTGIAFRCARELARELANGEPAKSRLIIEKQASPPASRSSAGMRRRSRSPRTVGTQNRCRSARLAERSIFAPKMQAADPRDRLMDRAALSGHVRPERGERLLQSRRAVNKDELGCPQATRGKNHPGSPARPPRSRRVSGPDISGQGGLLPGLWVGGARPGRVEISHRTSLLALTSALLSRLCGSASNLLPLGAVHPERLS